MQEGGEWNSHPAGQYGSPGRLLKIVITLKEQLWNPHLPLSSSASLTPHSLLPLPSNSATWRDTWLATGASGGRPGHLSQPKGFTANSLHKRFRRVEASDIPGVLTVETSVFTPRQVLTGADNADWPQEETGPSATPTATPAPLCPPGLQACTRAAFCTAGHGLAAQLCPGQAGHTSLQMQGRGISCLRYPWILQFLKHEQGTWPY